MKIPKNLTEEEVLATITKIAKTLAPKFVFASYDIEDIFQEAFIIGIEGLDKYDQKRPLANFLFTHISNRLKNFKRDNYYRLDIGSAQQIQDRKKNLLEPIDIDSVYSAATSENVPENAYMAEILKIIDERLPAQHRRDYLKLKTNSPMPKGRKAIILQVIKQLINGGDLDEHEEG